ncbi:hypothetical protein DNU06_07075 [Putridiphycobacter roseus]|uniref:Uncharacterized protein n=1 Tax=Putridiphycobacter roseus TaxID=2219161 RepID=A0A2W1N1C0_9FLAO|nr:hypothetical protein [Putridiphycobacter roseus]PZE17584.1 hypothetical protein DNU06_07075 [Putridiphycobacter roseus]
MKEQEENLLDNLFDSARNAAPEYTFKETKKAFLSAAVIGAAVLGLKTITSSILKTKFFIMTITTATIITSAVVIYNTSVAEPSNIPSNHLSNEGNTKNLVMAMPAPDLFKAVAPKTIMGVEPDDTTKQIEAEAVIEKEMKILQLSQALHLDSLIGVMSNINIHETGKGDHKKMIITSGTDTIMMQNVNELTSEIESALRLAQVELDGQLLALEGMLEEDLAALRIDVEAAKEASKEIIEQEYFSNQSTHNTSTNLFPEAELNKVAFVINENTDTDELAKIRDQAVAAGIDFVYTAKVKRNEIKKLDLNMKLEDEEGNSKQSQFHITKSKGEVFSITLAWYENEKGEAVAFSKSKDKKKNCKCN